MVVHPKGSGRVPDRNKRMVGRRDWGKTISTRTSENPTLAARWTFISRRTSGKATLGLRWVFSGETRAGAAVVELWGVTEREGLWIMPLCGFVDRRRCRASRSLPRASGFAAASLIALA